MMRLLSIGKLINEMPVVTSITNYSTLTSITGNIFANNTSITNLNLTNLQTLTNGISLINLPMLNSLIIPNLQTASFIFISNTGLPLLSANNLTTLMSLSIINNTNLANITFPLLVTTSSITIRGNPLITNLNLTSLQTVNGSINIGDFSYLNNLNLPLTSVNGNFYIMNTTISSVILQLLTYVSGGFVFSSNTSLNTFVMCNLQSVSNVTLMGNFSNICCAYFTFLSNTSPNFPNCQNCIQPYVQPKTMAGTTLNVNLTISNLSTPVNVTLVYNPIYFSGLTNFIIPANYSFYNTILNVYPLTGGSVTTTVSVISAIMTTCAMKTNSYSVIINTQSMSTSSKPTPTPSSVLTNSTIYAQIGNKQQRVFTALVVLCCLAAIATAGVVIYRRRSLSKR